MYVHFISQIKEEVLSGSRSSITSLNDDVWPRNGKLRSVDPRERCQKTVRELNRSAKRAYFKIDLDFVSL